MDFQSLRVNLEDGVLVVAIDRPQVRNALDVATVVELRDVVARIGKELPARALLLTGTGNIFSAGADLSDPGVRRPEVLDEQFNPLAQALVNLPVPYIAAVNGGAAGVGCSIALLADVIIAGRSAFFLQAFSKVGLAADGGASWTLPRLVGTARARAMLLLADRISATQAEAWGMIYQAVEDDMLAQTALATAKRLAAGPTAVLNIIRQAVRQGLEEDFSAALEREVRDQHAASKTEDHREALAAFFEKRPPSFTGK